MFRNVLYWLPIIIFISVAIIVTLSTVINFYSVVKRFERQDKALYKFRIIKASMNLLIIQDFYLKTERLYRINFHSIRFYHKFNIPWPSPPPSPLPRLLLSEQNGCIGGGEGVSECKIIRSVVVTAHFIPLQMDLKNMQTMSFFSKQFF